MRIFYDTEFAEDGKTIALLSIGMVAENGDEYYAIVGDDYEAVRRALRHDWLKANVIPHLPFRWLEHGMWGWDPNHPDFGAVKPRAQIAAEVRHFILSFPDPQLWAWYAAYDHVVLCQLWGRMVDLPDGVPMFTCDLKQECVRLGNPHVPEQESGQHNALEDARHNLEIAQFLERLPQ